MWLLAGSRPLRPTGSLARRAGLLGRALAVRRLDSAAAGVGGVGSISVGEVCLISLFHLLTDPGGLLRVGVVGCQPKKKGSYSMEVTQEGKAIPGSPFRIEVGDGQLCQKVHVIRASKDVAKASN